MTPAENDYTTLVAVFRTQIADANQTKALVSSTPRQDFAMQLRRIAHLILDGWGSSDAQYPQQCFDDHGPAMILRALATAYEQPAHVVSDVVEFP